MPAPKEIQAHENHDVLLRLEAAVGGMSGRFEKFAADQEIENKLLHARITETQTNFLTTFSQLKEGMAEKGRITPAFVAIILSLITIFSGAGAAYVGMMNSPLEKAIAANRASISEDNRERAELDNKIQRSAIQHAVADAKFEQDREWITKLLDETRLK